MQRKDYTAAHHCAGYDMRGGRFRFFQIIWGCSLAFILFGCAGGPNQAVDASYRLAIAEFSPALQKYSCRTPSYIIYTDKDAETAVRLGEILESAGSRYRFLLGLQPNGAPVPLVLYAYGNRKEYEAVAASVNLTTGVTEGFYVPLRPAAVHLYLEKDDPLKNVSVLLHEGFHQFADRMCRVLLPSGAASGNSAPEPEGLLPLPLWLNEGLATYMEVPPAGESAENGLNPARLGHLQELIRKKRCPSVEAVLARRYGDRFTAEDYAVAWGVVYALRRTPLIAGSEENRRRFSAYCDLCIKGFCETEQKGACWEFLAGAQSNAEVRRRWNDFIAASSLHSFRNIFLGSMPFESWQRQWEKVILDLDT